MRNVVLAVRRTTYGQVPVSIIKIIISILATFCYNNFHDISAFRQNIHNYCADSAKQTNVAEWAVSQRHISTSPLKPRQHGALQILYCIVLLYCIIGHFSVMTWQTDERNNMSWSASVECRTSKTNLSIMRHKTDFCVSADPAKIKILPTFEAVKPSSDSSLLILGLNRLSSPIILSNFHYTL